MFKLIPTAAGEFIHSSLYIYGYTLICSLLPCVWYMSVSCRTDGISEFGLLYAVQYTAYTCTERERERYRQWTIKMWAQRKHWRWRDRERASGGGTDQWRARERERVSAALAWRLISLCLLLASDPVWPALLTDHLLFLSLCLSVLLFLGVRVYSV